MNRQGWKYYVYLEQNPTFKAMKNEYIDSIKHSYFDALDKIWLLSLLNRMCENELKELFHHLDNDIFFKYVIFNSEHPKDKVLLLEDNNN